jgi:hypothetical protein
MPRWRLTMTIPRILTACGILLAWPAHNADAVSTAAVSGVDINHCLRIANNQAKPDEAHCPGFIVTTLIDARNTCREVGGKIRTYPPTKLWSIDVNADGQPEYLFDYSQNVGCDDAESVFSCGSLGCGLSLFAWRDDQWRIIGNLPDDPTAIEAVPASGQGGYADLRAVCVGCTEIQRYRWSGHDYALAGLEVRGHAVDIPSVRGQLWMLTSDVAVLAEPKHDAKILGRYKARTNVVILGKARTAPYFYISPCNACKPGFVEQTLLRRGDLH